MTGHNYLFIMLSVSVTVKLFLRERFFFFRELAC